jgi:hypothetical protein
MPPFNTSRTYPPGWTDQLRSAVLSPDVHWTPAEDVGIVAATRALQGWLADRRPYDGQHRQGWKSAIADFQRSVSYLGPALRAVLGTDLVAAVSAVSHLDAGITSNVASTAALLQACRNSDQQFLDQLSARWTQPQTRIGAWSDLREACRDPATTWETLSLRRELFWQLVREGGYGAEQMSHHLAGVLGSDAFQVSLARFWLGDINEDDVPSPLPAADAELTEVQQLELCERLLTKPPTRGHYVVWIAFDLAGNGRYTQDVGPVSFYKAQWLQHALRQGGQHVAMPVPGELRSAEGLFGPRDLPDGAGEVLARVDLGTGAWTDPVRVATEQAEAVVALAGFNIGETRWRRMTGYLVAVDDHIEVLGRFEAVRSDAHRADDTNQHAMDAELADLATKLRAHLPITDPEFSEVVKAVHWWEQARKLPPLAAVLLHVRVLELLSQRAGVTPWQQYVDEFLQARWARHLMMQRLHSVIDACLSRAHLIADQADRNYLQEFSRRITTPQPGGYALDLREGFNALPDLARIFDPHDNTGRRVQDAVSRFTLPTLPAWLADLESEWKLALERLRRVRNALAHGGPVDEESAETVQAFAEQLARLSLAVALQGLLEAKTVAAANRERKQWIDQWKTDLPAAANVPDALFGPWP